MPRVTDEHRERRRQQILAAARRCFIRQGFHQTSMADIFAEANLSSGAIYGYFRSKDELITAIAEEAVGGITRIIEPIVTRKPPPTVPEFVRLGLTATSEFAFGEDGFARLAPQVWAEAARNPALAEVLTARYAVVHGLLTHLVIAEQDIGRIAPDADPGDVATVLISTVMGYILQRVLIGNVEPAGYASALAALAAPAGGTTATPDTATPA